MEGQRLFCRMYTRRPMWRTRSAGIRRIGAITEDFLQLSGCEPVSVRTCSMVPVREETSELYRHHRVLESFVDAVISQHLFHLVGPRSASKRLGTSVLTLYYSSVRSFSSSQVADQNSDLLVVVVIWTIADTTVGNWKRTPHSWADEPSLVVLTGSCKSSETSQDPGQKWRIWIS
jgi:hypothetical protein